MKGIEKQQVTYKENDTYAKHQKETVETPRHRMRKEGKFDAFSGKLTSRHLQKISLEFFMLNIILFKVTLTNLHNSLQNNLEEGFPCCFEGCWLSPVRS